MGAGKSQDPSRRTKDCCAPLMVCIGRRDVRQWKPLDPGAFVQDGSRRRVVRSGPSMRGIGRLGDRQWKPLDPSVGALVLVYEKRASVPGSSVSQYCIGAGSSKIVRNGRLGFRRLRPAFRFLWLISLRLCHFA